MLSFKHMPVLRIRYRFHNPTYVWSFAYTGNNHTPGESDLKKAGPLSGVLKGGGGGGRKHHRGMRKMVWVAGENYNEERQINSDPSKQR